MRKVYDEREAAAALGARARETVLDRFSWHQAASRLVEITSDLRARRPRHSRSRVEPAPSSVPQSPYWLGLRVSVIVPTHNRKEKLLTCLDALARQSVLPQEFEVVVVDDGSTDGTGDALADRRFPFHLRAYRQDIGGGPGAARNLGIEQAAGELVLFIGDDILADERLLEEHLLAHAVNPDPGAAILGRIDWPDSVTPNAVMEYVCGDGMLQFAYNLIPKLATLDYTFFYTSNISLKRRFLLDAAEAGVRFDPCFRHAAFEDSEFAFRLTPRGLRIRYAERARVFHDHWMDLDTFAARELNAGEMAVVYYRKHPGQDEPLQVRWVAELIGPAAALLKQPELLHHLEAFDEQTNTLLRAQAASLEELLALGPQLGPDASPALSTDRLRPALHNVLRVIFDVERTRGKVQEWFSTVDDPPKVRAAQSLGSILRKIEFLNLSAGPLGLPGTMPSIDSQIIASLRKKIAELEGAASGVEGLSPARRHLRLAVRRLLTSPSVLGRLRAADRFVQARLQTAWLERYQRARSGLRKVLS
jgi:glycosyltransferase involved in cell wall biosynthesis